MTLARIRADLLDEQSALDDIVVELADEQWQLGTPSPGWSLADQVAHLTYFDRSAVVAITDPERFRDSVGQFLAALGKGDQSADELTLGGLRLLAPVELLGVWREARHRLAEASDTLGESDRVDWYGPSMSAKSFLTARLMETWAHGQDIVDTVGAARTATDRLHHIARLGFITRDWSYSNRALVVPTEPVRVVLDAPSGDSWTFGPDGASDVVEGPAEDFCLVVTRRRHLEDTALRATRLGREWMEIAQAFAGPPSDGPTVRP